ncbi:MAG: hypothetical protein R6X25_13600 [Candidatus Krumholzibacteriia bacterium]
MQLTTLGILLLLVSTATARPGPAVDSRADAPNERSRLEILGSLETSDAMFLRSFPSDYSAVSLDCDLVLQYQATEPTYYDVHCITVVDADSIEIEVTEGDLLDTVLILYCDPFDPEHSGDNAVVYDDDGGAGGLSAIFATDGVTLTPGQEYWLVICGYTHHSQGPYTIATSANIALCESTAVSPATWTSVKRAYR